jgi:hypothetical protein
MPRPLLLAAVWVAGMCVAVSAGLLVVRLVADQVGESPVSSIGPNEVPGPTTPPSTVAPTAVVTKTAAPTRSRPPASSRPTSPTVSPPATFSSAGGSLAVRCRGRAAELVYASPQHGWALDEQEVSGSEVEVRFERDRTTVRLKVACESRRPVLLERRTETSD